ncbi:MAG: hypothetical protein KAQ83_04635 [Nanoarchaeota archaeon]|nr:hypothetical protein [Nanoarchaeota archaeon]
MRKEVTYLTRFLILIIFSIILIQSALAATIYGTIYDAALDKAEKVKITIDTIPVQYQISKDSEYSFEVPAGTYTLKAEQYQYKEIVAKMQEDLTVNEDGIYRLDLILFPIFEDFGENETNFIEESITEDNKNIKGYFLLFIPLIILIIFILFRMKSKAYQRKNLPKTDSNVPADLQEIYTFIKKQKRATQKELRKQFPLSEAKISLMISDLEQRNLIKKLKKGRGNIIIIK